MISPTGNKDIVKFKKLHSPYSIIENAMVKAFTPFKNIH